MSETSQFTFVRGMTGVVVACYVFASAIAFGLGKITWPDFNGAVGPMAGLLLGYWVRGEK